MIVVDIEATWLDPQTCSILSIWAISLNKPEKTFYWECKIWDWANYTQEALDINWFSIEEITDNSKQSEIKLMKKFLSWLEQFDEKIIAWQHPHALDVPIMKEACKRWWINYPLTQKTVDLHACFYYYLISNWEDIPIKEDWNSDISLDSIATYFNLWEEPQPHNALTWAKYEAECFSRIFYGKNLLPEFS